MGHKALVFPGQGSQVIGMGKDFYENFKESRLVFEEASDHIHIGLKKLCFDGPLDELTLTENLQPALFTTEVAIFTALNSHTELKPKLFAGHSLGEYAALFAAGVLNISDGASLTRARGLAMQEAVPAGTGAMAALLGLSADQVKDLCEKATELSGRIVEPANFNSPGQVVISGNKYAVDAAGAILKENPEVFKGKFIPLQVSAPFHCSLMKPAAEKMGYLLAATKFGDFKTPVLANATAEFYKNKSETAELLTKQITGAVQWLQSMEKLQDLEISELIEVGPGSVLSGLMKRINKNISTKSISSVKSLKESFPS